MFSCFFAARFFYQQKWDLHAVGEKQDTLGDKEVIMSDELRAALQQYLVMRKDCSWVTQVPKLC